MFNLAVFVSGRGSNLQSIADKIEKSTPYQEGNQIEIIHQSTPWRGLSVLLGAMQLVKNPLIVTGEALYAGKSLYDFSSLISSGFSSNTLGIKPEISALL